MADSLFERADVSPAIEDITLTELHKRLVQLESVMEEVEAEAKKEAVREYRESIASDADAVLSEIRKRGEFDQNSIDAEEHEKQIEEWQSKEWRGDAEDTEWHP